MSKDNRHTHGQMSEAFRTAIFLTLSGGLQDAYTYMCRGKVFANAQTGNIVLMSSHFFDGEYMQGCRYLIPLCAFCAGILAAETIHRHLKHMTHMHWRQTIVLMEIVILFLVGFVPASLNTLANALVSFVCAMQVQTFRKVAGSPYASTMCIGNLRSGMDSLCAYMHTGNQLLLHKTLQYFAVIIIFALGAGIGSWLTVSYGIQAIWVSCILLSVSFCIMFIKEEIEEKEAEEKQIQLQQ